MKMSTSRHGFLVLMKACSARSSLTTLLLPDLNSAVQHLRHLENDATEPPQAASISGPICVAVLPFTMA